MFEAGYSTDDGTGFGLRIIRDIECTAGESGGARFEVAGVDLP